MIADKNVTTIETGRLVLRPFAPGDARFVIELLNTEGWLKFIGDRNVKTTAQAMDYLENGPFKSYRLYGFGSCVVQLKSNDQPIGMCGLLKRDYLEHPDIGFAFLPNFAGQGFAFEIAHQLLQHAFSQLQMDKILAITLPENESSIKLLKKLKFQFEHNFVTKETKEELSLYSATREHPNHEMFNP